MFPERVDRNDNGLDGSSIFSIGYDTVPKFKVLGVTALSSAVIIRPEAFCACPNDCGCLTLIVVEGSRCNCNPTQVLSFGLLWLKVFPFC